MKIKEMKRFCNGILGLLFFALLWSCAGDSADKNKLNVAVANNMQYAMKEIVVAFEKKHNINVNLSAGSSGTLTTQIKQGAPFDLFVSANMKYPNTLFKEKLATEKPKIYALGSLILWTTKQSNLEGGLAALLNDEYKKVAIANPETAPYGIAAVEAIKNAGLYGQLEQKLIWGEGIGQVNQYIESKSVDAGLTSKSVLYSKLTDNSGAHVEIDKSLYSPIEQGIVLLKKGSENNPANAQLFYNFMFSEETKSILTKFGYDVNGI